MYAWRYKYLVFLNVVTLSLCLYANENPSLQWEYRYQTPAADMVSDCITGDAMGNVFVTGYTDGHLDTETGTTGNAYLIKLDVQGNELWKRKFGEDFEAEAIVTDLEGSCYIVGYTSVSIDNQQTYGRKDACVVKFDAQGNLVWARFIGSSLDDRADALTLDEQGFCYMTGEVKSVIEADPTSSRGYGPFIAKYDKAGTLIWAKKLSIGRAQIGKAISILPDGNIYTAGTPGYMAQLDPNGLLINSCTIDLGYCINMTFDSQGNLYACGSNQADNWTGHVNKHGSDGTLLWHRAFRDPGWVGAKSIMMCTDGSGDVLLGGCQETSWGCQAFYRTYDADGNLTQPHISPG